MNGVKKRNKQQQLPRLAAMVITIKVLFSLTADRSHSRYHVVKVAFGFSNTPFHIKIILC